MEQRLCSQPVPISFFFVAENAKVRIEQDIDVFSTPTLRDEISDEIRGSDGVFTIDISRVRYIDSVGLGLLVYTKHLLDADGRPLRLIVEPQSSVERIVEITGLRSLLNVNTDGTARV
jgi:anti-sigma B factor antagonist